MSGFQYQQPVNAAGLYTGYKDLTALQIRDLFNTGIEIIPTPGIGKAIRTLFAEIFYTYNGVSYNAFGLKIMANDSNDAQLTFSSAYNLASDTINQSIFPAVAAAQTIHDNSGVSIYALADPGNFGNGTMRVYFTFQIIDL